MSDATNFLQQRGTIKGYLCERGAPGPKGDPGYR